MHAKSEIAPGYSELSTTLENSIRNSLGFATWTLVLSSRDGISVQCTIVMMGDNGKALERFYRRVSKDGVYGPLVKADHPAGTNQSYETHSAFRITDVR